jgi:hypothetical protein
MGLQDNSFESIEQILFANNNFKLKLQVNLSKKKGDENAKVSNIYCNSYKSEKYGNIKELKKTVIDTKSFLVINYNKTEETDSENIFLSSSQISEFKEIIDLYYYEMNNPHERKDSLFLIRNDNKFDIYLNEKYSYKYKLEGMTGKILVFSPSCIESKEDNAIYPVVKLLINDKNRKVILTKWMISSIYEILNNFNLIIASQNLVIINKLYENEFSTLNKRKVN